MGTSTRDIPLHLLELVLVDFPFGVALFQYIQGGFALQAAAWFSGLSGPPAAKDEVEAQANHDEPENGHEHGKHPQVPLPVIVVGHNGLLGHKPKACAAGKSPGDPAGRPYL